MAGDKAGRPAVPASRDGRPGTPAGSVEQRVERWAAMLDDAVNLLNQVMNEVKEAGKHDDE